MTYKNEDQKVRFLKSLFDETYIKDIKDRHGVKKDDDLEELINIGNNIGVDPTFKCLRKPKHLIKTRFEILHSC